jgi:4-hydroxy-2-oxoheptanedioate aldolase
LEPTVPEVRAAIRHVLKTARDRGMLAGIHCGSPANIREMWAAGAQFCSLLSDMRLFANGLAQPLAELRDRTVEAVKSY